MPLGDAYTLIASINHCTNVRTTFGENFKSRQFHGRILQTVRSEVTSPLALSPHDTENILEIHAVCGVVFFSFFLFVCFLFVSLFVLIPFYISEGPVLIRFFVPNIHGHNETKKMRNMCSKYKQRNKQIETKKRNVK